MFDGLAGVSSFVVVSECFVMCVMCVVYRVMSCGCCCAAVCCLVVFVCASVCLFKGAFVVVCDLSCDVVMCCMLCVVVV